MADEVPFAFCTNCGADFFIAPTDTPFQDLIEEGCIKCGGKKFKAMKAGEGNKWRAEKWPKKYFRPDYLPPPPAQPATLDLCKAIVALADGAELVHRDLHVCAPFIKIYRDHGEVINGAHEIVDAAKEKDKAE